MTQVWKVGIVILSTLLPVSTEAQDSYKWSDIDCSQSRIVPLTGVKCRGTNVVSGGESAGGQFQRWAILGSQPYLHVQVHESLDTKSFIRTRQTGSEYLQSINSLARNAATITEAGKYGGADYYLFKANEEDCMGFRRYGPSRSLGYAWIMGGVTCAPKGTPLSQARINEFIDSARVK